MVTAGIIAKCSSVKQVENGNIFDKFWLSSLFNICSYNLHITNINIQVFDK